MQSDIIIKKFIFAGDKMLKNIHFLYQKLELSDYKNFFSIETDFFLYLSDYASIQFINAYLIVSDWFGTSQRSGVWTFYEATEINRIQNAISFLSSLNENTLSDMLEKGIHDYQNPIYSENYDYPDEWIDESEEIDNWISEHEDWLWNWLYTFLLSNKNPILNLAEKK